MQQRTVEDKWREVSSTAKDETKRLDAFQKLKEFIDEVSELVALNSGPLPAIRQTKQLLKNIKERCQSQVIIYNNNNINNNNNNNNNKHQTWKGFEKHNSCVFFYIHN